MAEAKRIDQSGRSTGYSYTEYGLMVDRREDGLGLQLLVTHRNAEHLGDLGVMLEGAYPFEVMERRVYVTGWQHRDQDKSGWSER